MVITNNEKLYWNAKRFADRGKPFNSKNPTNLFLGAQYRVTELQAAIGRVQLKKLKGRIKKRQSILKKLNKGMKNLKAIRLWKTIEGVSPNPWFCFVHYEQKRMKVIVLALRCGYKWALQSLLIFILYLDRIVG